MLTLMNAIPEMSIVVERKIIQKRFNSIFSMTYRKDKLDNGYQLIAENFIFLKFFDYMQKTTYSKSEKT